MLWLFIGFLILVVSLVIHFLQQVLTSRKRNRYSPPSDALFDQVLPEEIFEHVLSFSDPLTLVRCHFVNKYWDYQASKRHIMSTVLESAINKVQNLKELQKVYKGAIPAANMLPYSPDYPLERRLADFAMAQKQNKHLLELNTTISARELRHLNHKKDFLLKTVGTLNRYPTFQIHNLAALQFSNVEEFDPVICNRLPTGSYAEYELIVSLVACLENYSKNNLLACRPVKSVKYLLGGIVPLDERLLPVMIMLFVPLIVHDVIYSEWFMNFLNYWFGTVAYSALLILLPYANAASPRHTNYPLYRGLVAFTIIASVIVFFLAFPHSADHFGFITIFMAAFVYGYFAANYFFEINFSNRKLAFKNPKTVPLLALIVALVIFINDYTMVYKSILDGTIFYRLFWNTIHWAIFAFYFIWNNVMLLALYRPKFSWRFFITWEREAIKFLFLFYAAAVFVTLYAPYWGYSILPPIK